ncbi:hypothetical protein [Ligilactobacillus agilis]|nr:hypothetical protein [Ligilactobacillus agilis]
MFKELDSTTLQTVFGGGRADYNFGYAFGRGLRKWVNKHFH